jgi:LacI family transcriptional regulator
VTTLKDVAKLAGVSRATVSLVCRGSPLVADKTRLKVERGMAELSYVYNRSAANLRSSKSNTVGLIIPDLANPIYSDLLKGIEDVLDPLGKVVLVADSHELLERQSRFLLRLLEMRVDGLILSAVCCTPPDGLTPYSREKVPVVQVLRMTDGAPFDSAGIDNRLGSRQATDYLIALGHQRLAYIGSSLSPSVNRERYQGFCEAVQSQGLAPLSMPVLACRHSYGDGSLAAKTLLAQSSPPTALICFNDEIALGATLGLYELGLVPGQNVSVIGFGDIEAAASWRPPLATMSIDARLVGRNAGTLLAQRMENRDLPVRSLMIDAVLKKRESCGPPGKSGPPRIC